MGQVIYVHRLNSDQCRENNIIFFLDGARINYTGIFFMSNRKILMGGTEQNNNFKVGSVSLLPVSDFFCRTVSCYLGVKQIEGDQFLHSHAKIWPIGVKCLKMDGVI